MCVLNAVIGSASSPLDRTNFTDTPFSPSTLFGFAMAGGGTNWGLANGLGGGRSDAFQAGLYGVSNAGPAYLAGALAFTNHWFLTSRTALGDQLTGRFQGQSYGARLEGGYRVAMAPWLGVTPMRPSRHGSSRRLPTARPM